MKVIVVGAGAAGLAATHELRKKGVDVITLEERDHPGGRTSSIQEDGYIIDVGAQFMSREYGATLGLMDEVGLGDDLVKAPVRIRLWNDGRSYPLGMSPDPRIIYRNLEYFLKCYRPGDLLNLVKMTAYVLRRWKDFGTIHEHNLWDLEGDCFADLVLEKANREVLEEFFQPVISGLILEEPERVGAILGLVSTRLTMIGFLSGLLTPRNGFGSIADRIESMYKDSFLLSTPAERIVIENGAVKGVDAGKGFMDADAVVCATTATTATRLLPDLPVALKETLGKASYSACCHVIFGVGNRPFPEGEFARYLPRSSGSPIAFIGSGRAKSPDFAPPGRDLVHCFTYGRHAVELNSMTDEEVLGAIEKEASKYLPGFSGSPVFSRVVRFDEAVFLSPPGTLARLKKAAEEISSVVKGLHLAGEYTNVGGVETAVQSGIDAAERVVGKNI